MPDESWRWVTAANGSITTFVTPRGPANVWVEFESRDLIVLRGTGDIKVNFFVLGVRDGFIDHQVIRPNTSIIPTYRNEPYSEDKSERYKQILIQNGTLNPDLTPNEATARRLGWELKDREDEARPRPVRDEVPRPSFTPPRTARAATAIARTSARVPRPAASRDIRGGPLAVRPHVLPFPSPPATTMPGGTLAGCPTTTISSGVTPPSTPSARSIAPTPAALR